MTTGNFPELVRTECGVTEAKWQEKFGNVCRIKASFGVSRRLFCSSCTSLKDTNFWQEDRLWIADPKALQHIFRTSGYDYRKPHALVAIAEMLTDRGLVWAHGTLLLLIRGRY